MAELEASQQQDEISQGENLNQKLDKLNLSAPFSIWPPSDRTREAVVKRLIDTLTNTSVLSKRYGSLPLEEATATARVIEEEAFNASGGSGSSADSASLDGGIEILQVYSKEISKRMLDAVKSRAPEANQVISPPDEALSGVAATGASEEVSSVENES